MVDGLESDADNFGQSQYPTYTFGMCKGDAGLVGVNCGPTHKNRLFGDCSQTDALLVIHDVLGNPFRPVILDTRWLTQTAIELARGIYAEPAFNRLPILADALEESGCDHAAILEHCRDPGPHWRGCWALDLILGKA
jgi:hypothetical protein